MKITVSKLLQAEAALNKLAQTAMSGLPQDKLLGMYRLVQKISPELIAAKQAQVALMKKCGGVANGQYMSVPPERMDEFTPAMDDYLKQEMDVDVTPVPVIIQEVSGILTILDLMALDPFMPLIEGTQAKSATN